MLKIFEEMFKDLNIEFENVLPDKFSSNHRDVLGIKRMLIDGYELCFDDCNNFICINKKDYEAKNEVQ